MKAITIILIIIILLLMIKSHKLQENIADIKMKQTYDNGLKLSGEFNNNYC